jgi:PKD domain
MVGMSRTVKSAIFFSAVGIAVGLGIMLLIVNNQTLRGIFQPLVGGSSSDKQGGNSFPFAIRENYKAKLALGEEGAFRGVAGGGKEPYTFEWKFSDGLTLTGQNVTRSFNVPGTYHIEVTVTDADGKQVKNTNLTFDVSQEASKGDGTANASLMQHN